jgi:hypothetical protein
MTPRGDLVALQEPSASWNASIPARRFMERGWGRGLAFSEALIQMQPEDLAEVDYLTLPNRNETRTFLSKSYATSIGGLTLCSASRPILGLGEHFPDSDWGQFDGFAQSIAADIQILPIWPLVAQA